MTRVSPPELARELPGPQASRSVTRAPLAWRRRNSAVQPPNAPAPTTTTCACLALGIKPPRATVALVLRNERRSTVAAPRALRAGRSPAPRPGAEDPRGHRTRRPG